jgi:acyl carrier protein
MATPATADDLSKFIAGFLSEQLDRSIGTDAVFAQLGLDSLDFVRLTDALAERMGIDELPVSLVLEHPTITALATHLSASPNG